MSVLVFAEVSKGKVRKASLEAVNYASHIAGLTGGTVTAVVGGNHDAAVLADLGRAGAAAVLTVTNDKLAGNDSQAWAMALAQAVDKTGAQVVVFSHDLTAKAVAPRLAARLKAGVVPGAVAYPEMQDGKMVVRKNAFSGKATAVYAFNSDKKIITLLPNSFQVKLGDNSCTVSELAVNLDGFTSKITIKETKQATSTLNLPEAELVVSAGRGMKGPENWGMVEELAQSLGAATACSRPIADMGWRPHHEHVGQTGVAIRPNLYIAIGISGAIQHLAGVNGSKTIVVINSDPEAPFFKSADYGIVGNAFEVLPKLTEAIKKFKASQN